MKCLCGCGRETKMSLRPPYGPNSYIHGHATRKPMELRFWKHVRKTSGCWEWTGKLNTSGYGRIARDAPEQYIIIGAHRYSYTLHYGLIPDGLFVCHHCDNRSCVRPDHLFLGTPEDNMQDAIMKHVHNQRKVFLPEFQEIKYLHKSGYNISHISCQVGLSRTTVSRIIKTDSLPPPVVSYESNKSESL